MSNILVVGKDVEKLEHAKKQLAQFFDEEYYRTLCSGLGPDEDAREHFIFYGLAESRNPSRDINLQLIEAAIPEFISMPLEQKLNVLGGLVSSSLTIGNWEKIFRGDMFPTNSYLSQHSDLDDQGPTFNPFVHWLLHGLDEGRSWFASQTDKRILLIDGIGNASSIYRVTNKAEAFRLLSIQCDVVSYSQLADCIDKLHEYSDIVLFRTPISDASIEIIRRARALGKTTYFDVDDLVFCKDTLAAGEIDGVNALDSLQRVQYSLDVSRYRYCAELCDRMIVSTEALALEARKFHADVHVIHNSASSEYVRRAALEWFRRATTSAPKNEVVYLSGSNTHDRDFSSALDGVLSALANNPKLRLRVVGPLHLPDLSPELEDRVVRTELVPYGEYYEALPKMLEAALCTIAPLDIESRFCQGKSALKFFEPALLGVPTCASPTPPFQALIENGVNGFLAEKSDEWSSCIEKLTDHGKNEEISAQARKTAIKECSIYSLLEEIKSTFVEGHKPADKITNGKYLNWVVPSPIPAESGGHNTILNLCFATSKLGIRNRLFLTGENSYRVIEDSVKVIRDKFPYQVFEEVLPIDKIDALDPLSPLILTHNSTHFCHPLIEKHLKKIYLVQDFEPMFSPYSYEYVRAISTYRNDMDYVTIGKWLPSMLKDHCGLKEDTRIFSTNFWIDRQYYKPSCKFEERKKCTIAFLARPSMPRRFYDLAIAALCIVKKEMPDLKIISFGEPSSNLEHSLFEYENVGVLSKADLAELYAESTIGLCFSTTNPSLITYEMLACGLPVIDLDLNDAAERHGGYPAILAPADPESLATIVKSTLQSDSVRRSASLNGVKFTDAFNTIEHEMDNAAQFIADLYPLVCADAIHVR
ncbi:glycosyl transferase, group 1 family [marine gamma proteobacterium HTCC2148]|nr:glycosyl transferase, group 1 family [marine gamma proteobacterium HTCC2148]